MALEEKEGQSTRSAIERQDRQLIYHIIDGVRYVWSDAEQGVIEAKLTETEGRLNKTAQVMKTQHNKMECKRLIRDRTGTNKKFQNTKLDILAICKTKKKGKSEVKLGHLIIFSGVKQIHRTKGSVVCIIKQGNLK